MDHQWSPKYSIFSICIFKLLSNHIIFQQLITLICYYLSLLDWDKNLSTFIPSSCPFSLSQPPWSISPRIFISHCQPCSTSVSTLLNIRMQPQREPERNWLSSCYPAELKAWKRNKVEFQKNGFFCFHGWVCELRMFTSDQVGPHPKTGGLSPLGKFPWHSLLEHKWFHKISAIDKETLTSRQNQDSL